MSMNLGRLYKRLIYLKRHGLKWWVYTKYLTYPKIPTERDIKIHQIWKKIKEKNRRKETIQRKLRRTT